MIIEIILFIIGVFVVSTIISAIIAGAMNVQKLWDYVSSGIIMIVIIGLFIYNIKFSTFSFIDAIFNLVWSVIWITVLFVVLAFVIGVELGNYIQSKIKKKK
jgi:hypothetical protein